MKKIVISCIFVLNAFQVNASQEGGLLGILAFSSSIAFIVLNQRDALITQSVFKNENDQKINNQEVSKAIGGCVESEILSEVEVFNENIFEMQRVGLVSSNYGYDFRASIPSGLHVPVWYDEDGQYYYQAEHDVDPLSESTVLVTPEMYCSKKK